MGASGALHTNERFLFSCLSEWVRVSPSERQRRVWVPGGVSVQEPPITTGPALVDLTPILTPLLAPTPALTPAPGLQLQLCPRLQPCPRTPPRSGPGAGNPWSPESFGQLLRIQVWIRRNTTKRYQTSCCSVVRINCWLNEEPSWWKG